MAAKAKPVPATRLTLDHCRKKGVETLQVVEQWVPFPAPGHRKDLFGFIDVLVVVPNAGILGIQATSLTNVSARLKKARDDDHITHLRNWLAGGGGFEVWGWGQPKGKGTTWTLRREQITLDDIGGPQC